MKDKIDHTDPAKKMNMTSGNGGETHQRAGDDVPSLTTNQGVAISDNQNYNGTALTTSTCDGSEYQQWQFSVNTDDYSIKSIATDRYIEVQGASTDPGAIVDQWNFYNGPNQKWILKSI